MNPQVAQFTTIKGLSDRRRLPRLGKIRLGVKVLGKDGKEHPRDVAYFVVPPEVAAAGYGPEPKALDVMFPVNSRDVIFPQAYKYYGLSKGLKCIGNGEQAMRLDEQTGAKMPCACPCELLASGQCDKRAHLMVILPKVNLGGVYQIDSTSFHTIVDVNSGLEYVENMVGRFAMVPLVLKRVPRETHGSGRREMHYPLQLDLATTDLNYINRLRSETKMILERVSTLVIPAPEDVNPELDEGATEVQEEDLARPTEQGPDLPQTPTGSPAPQGFAPSPEAKGEPTNGTGPNGAAVGAEPKTHSVPQTGPAAGQGHGLRLADAPRMMSEAQQAKILRLCEEERIPEDRARKTIQGMTMRQASHLIDAMIKRGDFSVFDLAEMGEGAGVGEERY